MVSRGGRSGEGCLEAGLQVRRESRDDSPDLRLEGVESLGGDRRVLLGGPDLEGGKGEQRTRQK